MSEPERSTGRGDDATGPADQAGDRSAAEERSVAGVDDHDLLDPDLPLDPEGVDESTDDYPTE